MTYPRFVKDTLHHTENNCTIKVLASSLFAPCRERQRNSVPRHLTCEICCSYEKWSEINFTRSVINQQEIQNIQKLQRNISLWQHCAANLSSCTKAMCSDSSQLQPGYKIHAVIQTLWMKVSSAKTDHQLTKVHGKTPMSTYNCLGNKSLRDRSTLEIFHFLLTKQFPLLVLTNNYRTFWIQFF